MKKLSDAAKGLLDDSVEWDAVAAMELVNAGLAEVTLIEFTKAGMSLKKRLMRKSGGDDGW